MEIVLEQIIFGRPVINGEADGVPDVLALSAGVQVEDSASFRQQVPLEPLPASSEAASEAIAIVRASAPGFFLLGRATLQDGRPELPLYQTYVVPAPVLGALGGDLEPLLRAIRKPLPAFNGRHLPIASLKFSATPRDQRAAALKTLLALLPAASGVRLALQILGAAFDPRGLRIRGFPAANEQRLALLHGLMHLLPPTARQYLTFSTFAPRVPANVPRIVFSEAEEAAGRRTLDWPSATLDEDAPSEGYAAHIRLRSGDDAEILLATLRDLDIGGFRLEAGQTAAEALAALANRHMRDLALLAGETLNVSELLAALQSEDGPRDELRQRYLEALTRHALDERDTEAAAWLLRAMREDESIAALLRPLLHEALNEQPDALYVFWRVRLSTLGIDAETLAALHQAAARSLEIAIEESTPETLLSWLQLIAREPASYEMGAILREGILRARARAGEAPALARDLLVLALKRDAELVETLLSDARFQAALPPDLAQVIAAPDPARLEASAETSREMFLLGLARLIDQGERRVTSAIVKHLWEFYLENAFLLTEPYQPENLIRLLVEHAEQVLAEGALETLVTLMLAAGENDLFFVLAPALAEQGRLAALLTLALRQSRRTPADWLDLGTRLSAESLLAPQQIIDLYAALLKEEAPNEETEPVLEHLARLLNSHADTSAPAALLWLMLDYAAEARSELLLRASLRRLFNEINTLPVESQLVEELLRLRKSSTWNPMARSMFIAWWRSFALQQSSAVLHKLERALEGKRSLEDLRSTVHTTLALRRMLANKSISAFAEEVRIAFDVLSALNESFDPSSKNPQAIDTATLRAMLEGDASDLTLDARHVLATNLRGLAETVVELAENRSKPSLIRSDEALERQLVSGEQSPQGAVDLLKWLSGYLEDPSSGESSGG